MARGQTAWTQTRQPASSFPSDRIRPQSNSPKPDSKPTAQQKQAQEKQPRSKEVERLDALINALKKLSGKEGDPKGGCFCLAREHPLSKYNPICFSCGLILCHLNLPQFACPHCTALLFAATARSELQKQLEQERDETLTRETLERERAIFVAKQAEGAFPSLPGGGSRSGSGASSPAPGHGVGVGTPNARTTSSTPNRTPTPSGSSTPHKVLSLTGTSKGGNKKVIVSSYTTKSVSKPVEGDGRKKEVDVEPVRAPPPPREVVCYAKETRDGRRPWKNFEQPDLMYVPPPREERVYDGEGKKKGGGNKSGRSW